jgi:hypothetical protein
MSMIYQATGYMANPARLTVNQDFEDKEEARKAVEACDEGRIVTFVRSKNLPGCLPEFVDKSCSMVCWRNGVWVPIDIHERSY